MRVYGTTIRTLLALGLRNIARVTWYRRSVNLGVHPVLRINQKFQAGSFFDRPATQRDLPTTDHWLNSAKLFGWREIETTSIPQWSMNHLSGRVFMSKNQPWWKLPDFSLSSGDIKGLWEASRFEWVPAMAQRIAAGDASEHDRLEDWLSDWCETNPPYLGVHWKCGQEAAIRVLHAAMGSLMLGNVKCNVAAQKFLRVHLQRIYPTLSYAISQDNNHATSEAAALYIGGSWLVSENPNDAQGMKWLKTGKRLLQSRVQYLVMEDGSFSQNSVNYHRLLLDTLSLCEIWRRRLGLPGFCENLYTKSQLASNWLRSFVDPHTGDAPNIGANDSARLFPIGPLAVRDFRGTVQLASVLFSSGVAYKQEGHWDIPLKWLGITRPTRQLPKVTSHVFENGGYGILRDEHASVFVRIPQYKFRPSHADALHLDLWLGGVNVLRDGGSYCYNGDESSMAYFPGTRSHNTVQFDDRDQMPRLSRFLFGDWLQPEGKPAMTREAQRTIFAAGYVDRQNAAHRRCVSLSTGTLSVEDEITGFCSHAILRWRLPHGASIHKGYVVKHDLFAFAFSANVPITRFEIVDGLESRLYGQKTACPVLEVEVRQPGKLESLFTWDLKAQRSANAIDLPASERIHDAHTTDSPSICIA